MDASKRPEAIAAYIVGTLLFGRRAEVSAFVALLVADFCYHPERIVEAIARPREHLTALAIEYPESAAGLAGCEPSAARAIAVAFSRWSRLDEWEQLVAVGNQVLTPGGGTVELGDEKSDELKRAFFPGLSVAEDYEGLPTPCLRAVARALAES